LLNVVLLKVVLLKQSMPPLVSDMQSDTQLLSSAESACYILSDKERVREKL
jgi:hypothetical protein